MKFEPAKISKVIEQNYSYLMPDFYEMQIEYISAMNNIYKDLDTALIDMFLTNKLYQSENKEIYKASHSKFKINEISKAIGVPRETVRRKKIKLTKNKFIILNKNKKSFHINANLINKKVFEPQIKISSKMLSNYCNFFSNKDVFNKDLDLVSFKNNIKKKFTLYLPILLNFQISYFTNWRKFMDMECIYIALLCALNTSTQLKRKSSNNNEIFDSNEIFDKILKLSDKFGLNSTSIAEITKIPRTTVLRKLVILQKLNILKKDKFKRYETESFVVSDNSRKTLYPYLQNTIKLLGLLISECLEIYSSKELKII
jgi:hypothetical protein